ncbi:hypothetical protein DSL72_007643 [Monilinia vaccinii-corymbosi]|uniref:Uncharacterized protein n=1 Tax=Monilinia vaccinii-corymbosi TaxID=61207 RepID=A0A8A3PIC3_9HELO|nr:hypothetical protein DSL72_007643 [Monilinia vaccinii-corymbosi]
MGELDELVSTLLSAFTSGIKLLRARRRKRREESNESLDTDHYDETTLSRSFKRSRSDIREAYRRYSVKAGPRFSKGDAKARSSLSVILSRLNIAFASAVASFSLGKFKLSDQEALIKLVNESRVDVLHTLDGLSQRLSESSSSPVSRDNLTRTKRGRIKRSHSSTTTIITKTTALGPATNNGWVRPKSDKKDIAKSKTRARKTGTAKSPRKENPTPLQSIEVEAKRELVSRRAAEKRQSGFSFLSDSTKLSVYSLYSLFLTKIKPSACLNPFKVHSH